MTFSKLRVHCRNLNQPSFAIGGTVFGPSAYTDLSSLVQHHPPGQGIANTQRWVVDLYFAGLLGVLSISLLIALSGGGLGGLLGGGLSLVSLLSAGLSLVSLLSAGLSGGANHNRTLQQSPPKLI